MVGYFSAFSVTHFRCDSSHLQSDCTGPLAYQDHTRCSNHNRIPPSASEQTPTTFKFQPCPVLSNPLLAPVGLLSQPTLANHHQQHYGTLKHALPPSLIISSVHAPSIATRRHSGSLRGLCGRMLLIAMIVSQASHLFQKHYAMVRRFCRKPLSA